MEKKYLGSIDLRFASREYKVETRQRRRDLIIAALKSKPMTTANLWESSKEMRDEFLTKGKLSNFLQDLAPKIIKLEVLPVSDKYLWSVYDEPTPEQPK